MTKAIAALAAREELGMERYGKPIDVTDGRDWLQEAYEEALDMVVYLTAALEQRRTTTALLARVSPTRVKDRDGDVWLLDRKYDVWSREDPWARDPFAGGTYGSTQEFLTARGPLTAVEEVS